MRSIIKWVFWFLAVIGGLDSWIQFFWPAFDKYLAKAEPTIFALLIDLIKPISPIRPDVPFYGYLFFAANFAILALVFGAMKSFFNYIETSFIPVSVLRTDLELTFDKDDLSLGRVNRSQLLHANKGNVTAYHLNRSVERSGAGIDMKAVHSVSTINQRQINDGIPLVFGNERKVEIIEKFSSPLPKNIIASLLPDNIVLFLYDMGFFRKVILKREFDCLDVNEYNGKDAKFGLTSMRYPVSNVNITVSFPLNAEPVKIDFLHVKENTAIDMHPDVKRQRGLAKYSVSLHKFSNSSIYVYWENRPEIYSKLKQKSRKRSKL